MKKPRPIQIEGDVAYVPLTKGYTAVIDAADVLLVSSFNWCALVDRNTVYARRNDNSGTKQRSIRMHRVIMGAPDGMEIDHIDGNGLNNRRDNLRQATHAENMRNQRVHGDNTSGFRGVNWCKDSGKWRARIGLNGKRRYLGLHQTPELAYAAYCEASSRLHGDFGRVA